MSDNDLWLARSAEFWDAVQPESARTRWSKSPTIQKHINRKVCGEAVPGIGEGFHRLLAGMNEAPFQKAVSIGCGSGQKEMSLLERGVVERFYLYEISVKRVEMGLRAARERGLEGRVFFFLGDAFELCRSKDFDLMYWNNSLHHMPDTEKAIRWSQARLKPGGVFAMDDYVGPSRFQFPDALYKVLAEFRAARISTPWPSPASRARVF